jgi:hypothetical protein
VVHTDAPLNRKELQPRDKPSQPRFAVQLVPGPNMPTDTCGGRLVVAARVIDRIQTPPAVVYEEKLPFAPPDTASPDTVAAYQRMGAAALATCESWLDIHFPQWRDVEAHWGESADAG